MCGQWEKIQLYQSKTYAKKGGSKGAILIETDYPSVKANCPLYAEYVPHHPTDQCNYMMVDVHI